MVNLTQVAQWHRRFEDSCLRAEMMAREGHRRGCEDAEFVADGWRKSAQEHALMAATIETFMEANGRS